MSPLFEDEFIGGFEPADVAGVMVAPTRVRRTQGPIISQSPLARRGVGPLSFLCGCGADLARRARVPVERITVLTSLPRHQRRSSPVSGGPELSIIIPAYNEAATIVRTLTLVREYLEVQGTSYEVIVS